MDVFRTKQEVSLWRDGWRGTGKTIALVPTMGALHRGHQSLIEEAHLKCDNVMVSLFVNPLQFGEGEDGEDYPQDEEGDFALMRENGVDAVYAPSVAEVYGDNFLTKVIVNQLTMTLCGRMRPHHFEGVTTVVTKLFNLIHPDRAFFGKKDYQQYVIIRHLVKDLNMDVIIEGVEIVREKDGLAYSSRNRYLDEKQRTIAPYLYRSLKAAAEMAKGKDDSKSIEKMAKEQLQGAGFTRVDYVTLVDGDSLEELERFDENRSCRLCGAALLGDIRLIDNVAV